MACCAHRSRVNPYLRVVGGGPMALLLSPWYDRRSLRGFNHPRRHYKPFPLYFGEALITAGVIACFSPGPCARPGFIFSRTFGTERVQCRYTLGHHPDGASLGPRTSVPLIVGAIARVRETDRDCVCVCVYVCICVMHSCTFL
jgi:hypothetical protein